MNKFALMSAVALVGAAGFTACSSDDDAANVVLQKAPVVKTQFAINVPAAKKSSRMTADVTQMNQNFRGIDNIYLMPLAANEATGTDDLDKVIKLSNLIGFDGGAQDPAQNALGNYKVYSDVEIPIGTQGFLFYGTATASGTDAENGALTDNLSLDRTNSSEIHFTPVKIDDTNYTAGINDMVDILNAVYNAFPAPVDANNLTAEEQTIAEDKDAFTKLVGGSSQAVLAALEDLYNAAELLGVAAVTNKIAEYCTVSTGEGNKTLSWSTKRNFPESMGLPQGVAQVTFDNGAFKDARKVIGTTNNAINVENIIYPAELRYWTNTDLWATTANNVTSWPSSTTQWEDQTNWDTWTKAVTATSRTIALANNIDYGVAMLKTTVKCAAAELAENTTGDVRTDIDVPADGFTVTGILIGGQPTEVDWNFTDQDGTSDKFINTVFDNVMNGTVAAGYNLAESANYTMVLDNLVTGDTQVDQVMVAIELVNTTGDDFHGYNRQVIPAGGKFYMVGKLVLIDNKATTTATRIFQQDYTTVANFTIGSLQNAYVTIPDLRSTNLELGLSVDLKWEAGMQFDVTLQ